MANVVVIGAQWGDEGKGKVVDLLTDRADLVVRFQGGNNAGHTLVVEGQTTVLHLIPSGILHAGKVCVIGNGTVVDPPGLLEELDRLADRDIPAEGRLLISERAHVILPYHKRLDQAREQRRSGEAIGTTGRGIGPAYEDKASRQGIRMADLIRPELLDRKVRARLEMANLELSALHGLPAYTAEEVQQMVADYRAMGERLRPFIRDTGSTLADYSEAGRPILFEGAQGTLLDLDQGTYPYVTSSNTVAAAACTGSGVGPRAVDAVVGIVKAYTTRVGSGPFPTELHDGIGDHLRRAGHEFGSTTGRPRRCGWLDMVALRYAVRANSLTHLAITKLDVLRGLDPLRICVGYRLDGTEIREFPGQVEQLERCEPIYEELPGWTEDLHAITRWEELPAAARTYVERIAQLAGVPLCLVSVGPGRGEEILLRDPFQG